MRDQRAEALAKILVNFSIATLAWWAAAVPVGR